MEARVIGQYRVTGLLGEGGMGMVYAAEHTLLGRPAAIKVLLPELSNNQEIVTRFFNEARAATDICHPSIVEVYDYGRMNDGAAFIVMELLKGESLRARNKRMQLRWSTALVLTRQIAGALEAAHARGIVHRDLKPDNIFLVKDPEVPGGERIKLLDFGIAKLARPSPDHQKTRTGMLMGTPTYMAPEQCRGVAVDSRADLYALGCILFELCTGRPPFVGEAEFDVLTAHVYGPAPTIASLASNVPREIDLLVQRLLAKTPADRVQTAEELIRLVDAVSAEIGPQAGAALTGSTTSSGWELVPTTLSSAAATVNHRISPPSSRPRPRVLALAGAIATAAIAVVAVTVLTGQDESEPEVATVSTSPLDPGPALPPALPAPKVKPVLEQAPAASPPVALVDVSIDSTPAGAKLVVDRAAIGETPFRGTLPRRGGATIVVRLTGYLDHSIVVPAAGLLHQHVKLEPQPRQRVPVQTPRPNNADSAPARDQSVNPFEN